MSFKHGLIYLPLNYARRKRFARRRSGAAALTRVSFWRLRRGRFKALTVSNEKSTELIDTFRVFFFFYSFFLKDFKGVKILNTSTDNLIMKAWRSKDMWPDKSSRSADHIGNISHSKWLTDLRRWSGLDSFLLVLLLNWVHSKTKTFQAEFTHSTKLGRLAHPPSSMFTSLQVLRRCWIDPI